MLTVHRRIVQILKELIPEVPCLAGEYDEGVDARRPCFFVNIIPMVHYPVMVRYDYTLLRIRIAYYPSLDDEVTTANAIMYERLRQIFALNIGLEGTSLLIQNVTAGEDAEGRMMEFDFDVEYYSLIGPVPDYAKVAQPYDDDLPVEDPYYDRPVGKMHHIHLDTEYQDIKAEE